MPILPPEILYEILAYSIDLQSPSVTALMTTCSVFHEICHGLLYTALYFTSIPQLSSFIDAHEDTSSRSPMLGRHHSPRSVVFDIAQHGNRPDMFSTIDALFSRCFKQSDTSNGDDGAIHETDKVTGSGNVERDEQGRLVLDLLRLRANSHVFDPNVEMVYKSLSLVNPRSFVWTGRDPPHHFSIAIVPSALYRLFRVLRGYTHLIHLTLTHFNCMFSGPYELSWILPIMPSLHTLYLGQVVYLDPLDVCEFVLHPTMAATLESVNLVDAYRESIWGARLRRSDLERMISSPPLLDASIQRRISRYRSLEPLGYWTIGRDPNENSDSKETKLATIRRIVVCQGKTERMMGGDRVEEDAILI